jgi:hypothetical protein
MTEFRVRLRAPGMRYLVLSSFPQPWAESSVGIRFIRMHVSPVNVVNLTLFARFNENCVLTLVAVSHTLSLWTRRAQTKNS